MLTKKNIFVDEVRLDEDIVLIQLTDRDATWSFTVDGFIKWCNDILSLCNKPNQYYKFNWCLGPSNSTNTEFLIEFGFGRYGIFLRYYVDLASLKDVAEGLLKEFEKLK